MIHDAGIVQVYRVVRDQLKPPPTPSSLELVALHQFGERTVGASRFYQAAQAGMRVDRFIEIWRDVKILPNDICKIGDRWYLIQRTEEGEDEDGLLVTRLTLEAADGTVWEGMAHDSQAGSV